MSYTLGQLTALSETLQKEYDVNYAEALSRVEPWHNDLVSTFSVKQEAVLFPFIYNDLFLTTGNVGDDVSFRRLVGEYVRIQVKKAFGGVEIKQTDFNDPMMQSILVRHVQGLATQMSFYPMQRLCDALRLGDTDAYYTVYDGQQLFSSAHVINGQAFDNLETGVLSAVNLNNAIVKLQTVPAGPSGRLMPMVGAKYHLVIPPALASTARQILNNEWIGDGAGATVQNVYKGLAIPHVTEFLTDTNDWYVIAELPNNKPFIRVVNDAAQPGLQPEMNPTDPTVLHQDVYRWSIKSFEEIFPGQFWQMVKYTN